MRITEMEQEARKDQMIRAAYELFCINGIDNVSVMQIAQAAGVSPNSIFRYFNSKANLVQCTQVILWEEIAAHIMEDEQEHLKAQKTGLEEIEVLLYGFKELYENYNEYVVFSCESRLYLLRNGIKLPSEVYEKMMAPVYDGFVEVLQRGQRDGSVSSAQTPLAQCRAIWGVMRGFVAEIAMYDRIYTGENPWKEHFSLVARYILTALRAKE